MRLAPFADELDLCARCHEQCLSSSSIVLATGRHTLAPSRLALFADLLRRGDLEPSTELGEVFALGIGSGVEHQHCLYAGQPTWPDETRFSRAVRAELVDRGFASRSAVQARERIDASGDPFGMGPADEACIVAGGTLFFTDAATRALAPEVGLAFRQLVQQHESLASPLPPALTPLRAPSSAGFEALELGLETHARRLAGSLLDLAGRLGATRIVSESPEALVALREHGAGDVSLVHASEWLVEVMPGPWATPTAGTTGPGTSRPRVAVLHDSARLGRVLGIFDAPRRVLDAMGDIERRELRRARAGATPSGATFGFPDEAAARVMADRALDEGAAVGADLVVTTSAYDRRNLAAVAASRSIEVRDLLELVAEARPVEERPAEARPAGARP